MDHPVGWVTLIILVVDFLIRVGLSVRVIMSPFAGRRFAGLAVRGADDSAVGRVRLSAAGRIAVGTSSVGCGFDFVKFAEACGARGERVTDPGRLKAAFKRAQESGGPYVIDIVLEQSTDCSMGVSIASIREFE